MAYSARERYRKKNDIRGQEPILSDMGLSLERDMERDARIKAIELARQDRLRRQNQSNTTSSANAGDNRTTAYKQPQSTSVYGGLGTLPNAATQGMNTAANGADIDYSKVNENASKGWKGISALNGTKAKDKTISQEESLAHATEVMKPYTNNAKAMEILKRYSELEDSQDRSGMLNFQSIGSYSGQFDKLANDFINETGVSMDEFRQIAENYSYIKHSDERNEAKAKKKDAGIVANIAQGIGEAAISPLTNYQAMIGAMQNPNDPELGRDYNSPFMKHLNAQADTKEAFEAKTESLSPVAKTLANLGYDLTVTGTQSAAAALTGQVGLGSFAAGGYSQTLQESDERGLSEKQAQVYSAISGGLEYITERLPIEHLKKIYNGNIGKSATGSLKPYIKAALEQMGEEASEELVNGIADTIADGLINGDKSRVNTAIRSNINSGMSEEEATKSAYLDVVKNTGYSMLVAGLSAGVSAGPALATQAIETTRTGRDIARYENESGNLTRNTESESYIPDNREAYTADEDYEQAQDARQTILNASEKVAKGERISGREAREVYEKASKALESLNARRNVEAVKAEEGIEDVPTEEEKVEEYKAPAKTNEEIIEDIEFSSTPYQLAQAIDQVDEMTDEIQELIDFKIQELEMYNFKSSDVDNAVTEKKAFEMGQKGEAVSEEQLNAIPEADRQKILEANNQAYNKSILKEHPDAVADTKTGKYFVPKDVKVNGADVVIIDSEGNEHTDYSNPKINQALSVAILTSKDTRGHLTSESMYKSTPTQAAYAIGLAIKSPEATSALIRTAVEAIYNSASVGHTTFEEFEKNSKGLFTKVDRDEARFLYNAIAEEARKSDTRKTENTEGKKTSDKAVSDTLKEALPEETTALLEALSEKIGYNFVASTNKNARGSINPGTRQISIGTNSIDEVWSIVAHEAIGEYLQAHGKEEDVLAIQDDTFKYLEGKLGSDAFNDLINQYQSVYRTGAKKGSVDYGKSRRAAANEMFNDTIFALLSSEEGVKDYVAWLDEGHEKSFFEKVKDFFSKLVQSIRNYIDTGSFNAAERAALEMDYDQARAMRDRIFKAMDAAIANRDKSVYNISKNTNARNTLNVQGIDTYTEKEIENLTKGGNIIIAKSLDEIEDYVINYVGTNQKKKIYLGKIGKSLANRINADTGLNLEGYNIAITNAFENSHADAKKEAKQGQIAITPEIIKLVPQIISEYDTVVKDVRRNGQIGLKFEKDINGKKTIVEYVSTGRHYIYLQTMYGRNSKVVGTKKQALTERSNDIKSKLTTSETYTDMGISNSSITTSGDNATTKISDMSNNAKKIMDDVRHSFAGIGAETADKEQLKKAQELQKKGMGDLTILETTGWFLGMDNKWKFEIPDNDIEIFKEGNREYVKNNPDFARYLELENKILFTDSDYTEEEYNELMRLDEVVTSDEYYKTKRYGKLSDFIQHDELFRSYPWIENVDVMFIPMESDNEKGYADPEDLVIALNIKFQTDVSWNKDALKSTLLHEIQHIIQKQEGFAGGSTPEWWAYIRDERIERDQLNIKGAQEHLQTFVDKAKAEGKPTSTGEFVEQSVKRVSDPNDSYNMEDHWEAVAKWKANSSIYHYEHMISKLERHIDRLLSDSDIQLYLNTAGEIEARDTANRANWTKEQRLEEFPKINAKDVVYPKGSVMDRRYSIKVDSEGRSLSEGQQEYFKNSKVVDEEGRLKVVYHGTMAEFNIFDLKEARDTEDIEAFFFSGDYEESSGYGNVGEYYLNITNPADYDTAYDIFFKHKGKEHAGRLAREELQSMGYDGVIAVDEDSPEYTEYLVFDSNQIKRIDNKKPTESADVRYSIKIDDDQVYIHRGIEIVKNPTNSQYKQMREDILEERPWLRGTDEPLLRHTYDEDGNVYYWEALKAMHRDIEPAIRKHWNTRVAQNYEWWKDQDKYFWPQYYEERYSIKVYGEASPYADSINETKVISTMLGSMNNSLSQVDAFTVPNEAYMQIEKNILKKYNAQLEEGELAANVSFAFAYMQQNKLETNYEKMMNYLLNIGDEVIKNSNLKDPETEQLYNSAKDVVKKYTFKLSEADREEIKTAFGGNWKSAFGELQKAGIKLNNEKGVDIDTVFSKLQEEFLQSAGINLEKYDKPSEQILGLLDAMHALEPTAYLWDGANSMDKALTVVSDIINDYYSIATGQLASNVVKGTKKGKETVAAAINKEKSKLNQKFKEYKDNKTDEFNQIVAEKNRIIQEQQQKLKAQNEQMKKWNAELSETERKLQQGKLLTEKQVRQTAKLQAKEAVESYRQREERARQIENIKKTGIRLIKWLDNPTDNQHVPKFLQRPLAEFLSAIDFLPKNAKADSKSTLTWQQRMQSLRQALVKIKDAEAEADGSPEAYFAQNMIAKELLSMMDDFLGTETFDEFTQSYIVTKRAAKKVSLLDAKELATLNKIMSALSASINNMNKTYANSVFDEVSKLAKASVKEIDALPEKKDQQKMLGKVFNFLNFDEVEPITYFEGLGSGAKSVYQELRDGFNLKTKHVREADAYMDAAKKELGITDKELSTWKNQLHTFKLTEGTVMLNTTQIMSLYKILGRKQGKPHVAVGGIKSADFEYKDGKVMKKHHQAKAVHIRASEANAIINTLTDEQKALADKMQKFMAGDCAKWGNRVTEKMFGYKRYEEKDYFPLKTDAHSRATTASSDKNVSYYTIKNRPHTKPITPNANNAVVLDDIFDVFTNHVVEMAEEDAYVMPIADAMRWFNYSERVITAIAPDELNEQGARVDYIGNMQESIDRVYGDAGLNYFRQFIKDINGDYAGTGGTNEMLSSLMSMYKAQAVGANMRVVIQQPTAVVRASDVIEPTYLLQAMASLPKAAEYAKKAQNNSEIAYWKAQGYYETYLGQSFKEIITGDVTLKDKFNDWSGFLAGKADDLSWGIMYKAAELKTAKEHPELKGSAFDKAATRLFEDIVDHTQVVDTIFHKSQYMRNQGAGYKITSAFMAEPTKTYNMLYRAYRDAKLSGNQSFKVKRLRDVALIFLFEQILNAIITGGWDVLRDDEKTNYIESFREHFTDNAIDNLNPLNLLPILKEITSALQGYDATAYTTDAIYTAVDSFNALLKIVQKKSNKTTWGNTFQIAKAASQLTGVPVANVMREFKTIYNLVNDFWGGKDLVNSKETQKKVEKAKETNRIAEVFEAGDLGSIKSEITNTYNNAIADGKEESEAWSATRSMLKSQWEILVEANPDDMAAINNRFKTLLKYTKKADGKGGYRVPSDKEVANWIDNWKVED